MNTIKAPVTREYLDLKKELNRLKTNLSIVTTALQGARMAEDQENIDFWNSKGWDLGCRIKVAEARLEMLKPQPV